MQISNHVVVAQCKKSCRLQELQLMVRTNKRTGKNWEFYCDLIIGVRWRHLSISETSDIWVTTAEGHIAHHCQLRTGKRSYSRPTLTEFGHLTTGKSLPGISVLTCKW